MSYVFYALITLNGIVTLILGRRPIAIDKTTHVQYRLLGAVEATVYPVTLAALLVVGVACGLPADSDKARVFFAEHEATFRITRLGVLALYLVIMVVWESAIRKRIAAAR